MPRNLILVLKSALFISLMNLQPGYAQNVVVRVEEDWELHIVEPDQQLDAPQVTTTMIPLVQDQNLLFQIDFNHASVPSFAEGGIQIRACVDETCLAQVRLLEQQRLNHPSEVVRWTQFVQRSSSNGMYFGIINGQSASWGSFGGEDAVLYLPPAEIGSAFSLDGYDPAASIEHSGATYGGNRVAWLRLGKIRAYDASGQFVEWVVNQDSL